MTEQNEFKMEEKRVDLSGDTKQIDVKQLDENRDNLMNDMLESPEYGHVGGPVRPQPVAHQPFSMTSRVTVALPPRQVIVRDQKGGTDNCCAIAFSCFVIWFCCPIIGLLAFCMAVSAKDLSTLHKSYYINVAGIVCGVSFFILYFAITTSGQNNG